MLILSAFLLFFSFFFNKIYSSRSSVTQEVKKAENYLQRLHKDFNAIITDTGLITRLVSSTSPISEFATLTSKPYGIFLYSSDDFGNTRMLFWNDQLAVPPDELMASPEGEYFDKLSNGWYVISKKNILLQQSKVLAFALIPVRSEFFIETDYLPEHFFFSNTADKRARIS